MAELQETSINPDDLSIWFYERAKVRMFEPVEITENDFDYALGVVPPFYERDKNEKRIYGVSEMYSDNVTFWFTQGRNGKYYGLLSNLQTAKEKLGNL